MFKKIAISIVIVLSACLLFLYHHLTGPPIVYFVNSSDFVLEEAAITTSGGDRFLGTVHPGVERCCFVDVRVESGLAISFTAGSQKVFADDLAYLESSMGSCETVEINSDLSVKSTFRGPGCGFARFARCHLTRRCSGRLTAAAELRR